MSTGTFFSRQTNTWFKFCLSWMAVVALQIVGTSPLASAHDGFASDSLLHKSGLTVEWTSQASVGARGEIVGWTLNVNENKATTYFVLEGGGVREVISQHDLNAFGEPYGIDGAQERLEFRREILEFRMKNDGIENPEIKTSQYSLPESRIYVLTTDGTVTAIDADSGREIWTAEVGSPTQPSIGIGASTKYVGVINGSKIYCLDVSNGKKLWSSIFKNAASAAPAVSDSKIYVPLYDGRMQVFDIKGQGLSSFTLVGNGPITAHPLLTRQTVAWPTLTGFLNVAKTAGPNQDAISFRLRTSEPIGHPPSFDNGIIYTGSSDGYVYAIEESGGLLWETATGDGIDGTPVVIGDSVYVVTVRHQLARLRASNGTFVWPERVDNIKRYLGASQEKMYFEDQFGKLVAINPESGAVMSRVDVGTIDRVLENQISDRIYIASSSGLIKSIHESGSIDPYFHADELVANTSGEKAPMGKAADAPQSGTQPARTIPNDPFATGKSTPSGDPFTTGSDPFATGGNTDSGEDKPAGDDPFAADPFSNN